MLEKARIALRGNVASFRKEWEKSRTWPFSPVGVAVMEAGGPDHTLFKSLVRHIPDLRFYETIERTYSPKELLRFDAFCLWINHDVEIDLQEPDSDLPCPACHFQERTARAGPIVLSRGATPNKDLALTQFGDILVSERLAIRLRATEFTGGLLRPTTTGAGSSAEWAELQVLGDVTCTLAEHFWFEGDRCPQCGKYDKTHPTDAAKEVVLPREAWPGYDIVLLNRKAERSHTHRKLISSRFFRVLREIKATGYWVQPVHLVG